MAIEAVENLEIAMRKLVKECDNLVNSASYAGEAVTEICPECEGHRDVVDTYTSEGDVVLKPCPKCNGPDGYEPGRIIINPYLKALEALESLYKNTKESLTSHNGHSHDWGYVNDDPVRGACYCSICGISGDI